MRAIASVLAAWALGTVVSGQAFAQSYGPESDDDAGPPTTYSDRSDSDSGYGTIYRGRDEDFDRPFYGDGFQREPVRRYYRDDRSGEWRPLSRQFGSGYGNEQPSYSTNSERPSYSYRGEQPSYRTDEPEERYRRDDRVGEWRSSPRRYSSNYDRPSYSPSYDRPSSYSSNYDRRSTSSNYDGTPYSSNYDRPSYSSRYDSRYARPSYRDEPEERYRRDDRIGESRSGGVRRTYGPRERLSANPPERSGNWWAPEGGRRPSWDERSFKSTPRVTTQRSTTTTSGVRPAAENTVTIPAAEYRELQNRARDNQARSRPAFPDAPTPRTEPETREQ